MRIRLVGLLGLVGVAYVTAIGSCKEAEGPIAHRIDLSAAPESDLAGVDLFGFDLASADLTGVCPGMSLCATGCVDLTSSAGNCGRCEHSCLGGACMGGACQPITLATSSTVAVTYDLATDGVHVGWTNSSGTGAGPGANTGVYIVNATDKNQTPVKIAPSVDYMGSTSRPNGIIVRGAYLYWHNVTDPGTVGWSVYRAPVGGGTVDTLMNLGTNGVIGTFALNPAVTHMMVLTYDGTNHTVGKDCNPTGSGSVTAFNPVPGVAIAGGASGAADDTYVYWAEWSASTGSVRRFKIGDPATTAPVDLATGQVKASSLVLDNGYVYWATGSQIHRTPTTTAAASLVIDTGDNVAGLVVVNGSVIWADGATARIRTVPVAGGMPIDLATGSMIRYNPTGGSTIFGRDATAVYWADIGDNGIHKLALP